jgi:hypothetical protein
MTAGVAREYGFCGAVKLCSQCRAKCVADTRHVLSETLLAVSEVSPGLTLILIAKIGWYEGSLDGPASNAFWHQQWLPAIVKFAAQQIDAPEQQRISGLLLHRTF